jgi:hypothetical protein
MTTARLTRASTKNNVSNTSGRSKILTRIDADFIASPKLAQEIKCAKNDRVSTTIETSKNFHGTKMAQKFSETLILQAVYSAHFSLIT